MRRARVHLIATLVPDQDDERPVVLLDAIGDQRRYTGVELFPHAALDRRRKLSKSSRVGCKKNKAVGRSRMIDRHNPIPPV